MNKLSLVCIPFLCANGFCQDDQHPSGWVVIPVNEYGALRARAYPIQPAPELLRVEATLTRVDYELKLDSGIAGGRATLTIDVLKDGWVRVPIPPGLLVREARLEGSLVSLVPAGTAPGENDTRLAAVLSHKGRSVLTLDVAFTVAGNTGEERLSLPVGESGITRASVTRATQDVEVKIAGGFIAEKSPRHWLAYARGNEPLVFTWSRKVATQPPAELPLRMKGALTQLFGLGEDSTSLNAEVQVDVLQGVARQVRIQVPESVSINQVPGATVADWDVANGELVVNFLEPVERSAKFAINGETHLPRDGPIDVPLLRLQGTERDAGGAAVEVIGAGEIKESKAAGLDPVDAAELGSMVAARQSPSLAAFRVRVGAAAPSLHVQVARYAQQAVLTANVEEARYRVLMSVDGKTLVQARYVVRNNQRTFIRMALPEGASVWSSSLAGRPVHPGKDPSGAPGSLLFPLAKGRAGEEAPAFAIEILYLARGDGWTTRGHATLALPVLDLPVSRTGITLYYPPQFRVTPVGWPLGSPEAILDARNAPAETPTVPLPPSEKQKLVESYRARFDSRKTAAAMPVRVTFPAVGPSIYLVAELTAESKGATVDLLYQKEKARGAK